MNRNLVNCRPNMDGKYSVYHDGKNTSIVFSPIIKDNYGVGATVIESEIKEAVLKELAYYLQRELTVLERAQTLTMLETHLIEEKVEIKVPRPSLSQQLIELQSLSQQLIELQSLFLEMVRGPEKYAGKAWMDKMEAIINGDKGS